MSTPFHQHGYLALHPTQSFGRVKSFKPVPAASSHAPDPSTKAGTHAARSEMSASSLRASTASGFGDAAADARHLVSLLDSIELEQQARRYRSHGLAQIFAAMAQSAVDSGRQFLARWKRQRSARATYLALRALDARTLRDLGFDRSELSSVAAEFAGNAVDSTRAPLSRVVNVGQ